MKTWQEMSGSRESMHVSENCKSQVGKAERTCLIHLAEHKSCSLNCLMSQIALIFEVMWLTTSSIKNMFRIVLIPVFIIKNVVGEVDEFLLQAVPVCSM